MKSISLPWILKKLAGGSLALGSILLIVMVTVVLMAGFGAFETFSENYPFGLNISWPIYFEIEPNLIAIQNESMGSGTIWHGQGNIHFESPNLDSIGIGIELAIWVLILGLSILCLILMLYRIFDTMQDGTPFVAENIGRIRWIAGLLILSTSMSEIAQARIGERLFFGTQTEGIEFVYRININTQIIFISLIVLALAEVFRYGLELQTEADLTV